MYISDLNNTLIGFYPFTEIGLYSEREIADNAQWISRFTDIGVVPHFEIEAFEEPDFIDFEMPLHCTNMVPTNNLQSWLKEVSRIPLVTPIIFEQFTNVFNRFMSYFPIKIILVIGGLKYNLLTRRFVTDLSLLDDSYFFLDFNDIKFAPTYRNFTCNLSGEAKNLTTYSPRIPFEKIFNYKGSITIEDSLLLTLFPTNPLYYFPNDQRLIDTYSFVSLDKYSEGFYSYYKGIKYFSSIRQIITTLHHSEDSSEFTRNETIPSYEVDRGAYYRVISNGFILIFRLVGHELTYDIEKSTSISNNGVYPYSEENIYIKTVKSPMIKKYEVYFFPLSGYGSGSDLDLDLDFLENPNGVSKCCLAECFGITE